MKKFWIAKFAIMFVGFIALMIYVVMSLWNWLMPEIFDLPIISFWQAAGLLILSKILFGFGMKGKRCGHDHGPPWRNHWRKKWENMPEEQREKWKQRFADKWCNRGFEPKESQSTNQKDAE